MFKKLTTKNKLIVTSLNYCNFSVIL